jgi:hypothetical protein
LRLRPIKQSPWTLVLQHRTILETTVDNAMTSLMRRGIKPNKRQICEEIGLDYDDADDRISVTRAIKANRKYADRVYREVFISIGLFEAAYQRAADDVTSYEEWKRKDTEFVRTWYANGWTENDLREVWIASRIWEDFLAAIDRYNLHFFIAVEGIPWKRGSFRYEQPIFWDLLVNQIDVGRRLQKGVITILERQELLGMILTSGEPVEKTIQVAQDSLHMIADGAPLRHRCELCERQGTLLAFSTQEELFDHFQKVHTM